VTRQQRQLQIAQNKLRALWIHVYDMNPFTGRDAFLDLLIDLQERLTTAQRVEAAAPAPHRNRAAEVR
jgi:hypothetical protein